MPCSAPWAPTGANEARLAVSSWPWASAAAPRACSTCCACASSLNCTRRVMAVSDMGGSASLRLRAGVAREGTHDSAPPEHLTRLQWHIANPGTETRCTSRAYPPWPDAIIVNTAITPAMVPRPSPPLLRLRHLRTSTVR